VGVREGLSCWSESSCFIISMDVDMR
jgi:hypothetical protein